MQGERAWAAAVACRRVVGAWPRAEALTAVAPSVSSPRALRKEIAMNRLVLAAAIAAGVCFSTVSTGSAQSKRDPDVQKTLERAYPGAQTQVTGTETINGVKVFNVNVANKQGASNAQVTENGDFLYYGVPQQEKAYVQSIQQNVGQMFQGKAGDVQLYRSTSYLIDAPVQGQKGQTYQIRIDPVGRVVDIIDAKKAGDQQKQSGERKKADDATAKKIEQIARDRYAGKERELQRVTESDVPGFYEADFKGIAVTANEQGQILRVREDMMGKDMPLPVRVTTDQLVKAASRAQRVEEEYLQFTQQSESGNQVVIKMRPDGDILDVVNIQAAQEEQAQTAKAKQGAQPAQKKAGS
jgi:hypothetical protein